MRISDWSSDVCSSDLRFSIGGKAVIFPFLSLPLIPSPLPGNRGYHGIDEDNYQKNGYMLNLIFALRLYRLSCCGRRYRDTRISPHLRSEECRVGKECVSTCRSRGSTYH